MVTLLEFLDRHTARHLFRSSHLKKLHHTAVFRMIIGTKYKTYDFLLFFTNDF